MPNNDEPWVIPPPEPDTFAFVFRAGEGVELSPSALAALETLARELGDGDDVGGFQRSACDVFWNCRDGRCQPKVASPCAFLVTCSIA